MMNPNDVSAVLNFAADLFASSPRQFFTREEIVTLLRALPDEVQYQAEVREREKKVMEARPS